MAPNRLNPSTLGLCLVIIALNALNTPAHAFEDHVFVLTSAGIDQGNTAALDIIPPWTAQTDVEPVGAWATLRHFLGLHFVVNHSPDDAIQVIDPESFATILTFPVASGSNPQDITVIDEHTAYVSCLDSPWLFQVNPLTGTVLDSVSLAVFADDDGLPEAGLMARDGDHLLIQIRRLDREASFDPVPPSYLAVVDLTTDQLLDVDPVEPGIQGIELLGTIPSYKMQIEGRRLYVSAPGVWFDGTGGIEEIDLDTLQSLGFLTSEAMIPAAQMGTFILVSPEKGYVVNTTDLVISSHLMSFTRPDGLPVDEVMVTVGVFVENLVFDPATRQLFFPDSFPLTAGIRVLDTNTDTELTAAPVSTGLPPMDLVVAREPGPVAVAGEGDDQWPGSNSILQRAGLGRVYPNPFNPRTTIEYSLDRSQRVRISVLDIGGREVTTLVDGMQGSGLHSIDWRGRDSGGLGVASGLYFLRMVTPYRTDARPIMLIR